MALPMVDVETLCPNSSSKASRCSSRVRSSLASRCSGSHSRSIAPFLEGLPGMGSGSTSPVSRRLFSQRFMVGIDTEKVFATSSLGLPASTAESTLNLRSFEYGFMPGGYHICGSILTGAAVRRQWSIPPEANASFVWRMEDVLELYTRPYDPLRPQVCMDETSKQLLRERLASRCRWSPQESSIETMSTSVAVW